jgi:VanZ family protein
MRWVRYWAPAALWAVVISFASTGHFTSEKTAGHILPILRWLMPHADVVTLQEIHHFIRKGGHVFEYFVFALLLLYAIRGGRREWRWSWALATIFCVAIYAGADEFHQRFVPGRGASVWDALLDTAAGTMAILVAWSWWRWRAGRRLRTGQD